MTKLLHVSLFTGLLVLSACSAPQKSVESSVEENATKQPVKDQASYDKLLSCFNQGVSEGIDQHRYRDKLDTSKLNAVLASGVNVNSQNAAGQTALMNTTSAEVLNTLIEAGADVNVKADNGMTPLMVFARQMCFGDSVADKYLSNLDECKKLYSEEDIEDYFSTPGDVPCASICTDLLIKAGADVNARDNDQKTPLMYLRGFYNDSLDFENDALFAAKHLIKAGADVNAKDNQGKTALMYTTDLDIMKLLVEAGADVNIQDNAGETAVMKLSYYDFEEPQISSCIDYLISKGADLELKNNDGVSAKEMLDAYLNATE